MPGRDSRVSLLTMPLECDKVISNLWLVEQVHRSGSLVAAADGLVGSISPEHDPCFPASLPQFLLVSFSV